MEPAKRVLSNHSTKSYLERELIVSLDNDGPMIGPTLETLETTDENTVTVHQEPPKKEKRWWKSNDTTDPRQYSRLKKNIILFIIAIAGSISPVASTVYYPAIITMQTYFKTDDTTMNASLSVFTFLTAFFPLVWATFSDRFGRRNIYLISFAISVIGSVCCAVSINVQMFIAFRAISAVGSSSVMSMGAGTIADVFEPHERGRAFAYYTCGPLLGPALGPIIGGYLNQGLGWRSNFWFLAIFAFCIWFSIFFFLPETWRESPALPSEKQDENLKRPTRIINPISALRLLLYPNIALAVTFVGVLFFVLYLNNTTFTRVYSDQYGFSSGIVGLCYLPLAAGSMAGGVVGGRLSDQIYNARVAKAKEKGQEIFPEMRLNGLVIGGSNILQLFSLVAYGWCLQKNVHFAFGLVCQVFYGFAAMLPNVTISAYMVDCFRKQGASVTACNNFLRYLMAGVGSLIASDIQHAMGNGPLFTFGGALMAAFSINIFIIKRYPKKWASLRKDVIQ